MVNVFHYTLFSIDFFRNVVTPLFELWDQYLSSSLSRQLIVNLRFNNGQWQSFLDNRIIARRHSVGHSEVGHRDSCISLLPLVRSKSLDDLMADEEVASLSDLRDWCQTESEALSRRTSTEESPLPSETQSLELPPLSGRITPPVVMSHKSYSTDSSRFILGPTPRMPTVLCHVEPPHSPCEFDFEAEESLPGLISSHPLSPHSAHMFIDKVSGVVVVG